MLRAALIFSLLFGGCASAPPRGPDPAPERLAAQRATDPNRHSEEEERRWGFEQAKQRKQEQRQKRAQEKQVAGGADVVKDKDEAQQR